VWRTWTSEAEPALPHLGELFVPRYRPLACGDGELRVFGRLAPWDAAMVRVVEGDADAYVPEAPVDLLMPDIWLPLVSDGRVQEVLRMQATVQSRAVYSWGQEMEIARHAAAAARTLDDNGIAATVAEWGLPLLGSGTADDAVRSQTAAQRWMRGRWLPGR
jgi:hypothetical protein